VIGAPAHGDSVGRRLARLAIRAYQLTLSGLIGRTCRHLPTCSDYAAEAVTRHGVWPGAWMAAARICRCGPGGTSGLDFVCRELPPDAAWHRPWRYGLWRGTQAEP
jgi:putative membrane protein insertion efficiency factor